MGALKYVCTVVGKVAVSGVVEPKYVSTIVGKVAVQIVMIFKFVFIVFNAGAGLWWPFNDHKSRYWESGDFLSES